MTTPQSGILPDGNRHAVFLTLRVDDATACRAVAAEVPRLTDEVAEIDADAGLGGVIAIDADAWDWLYPDGRPDGEGPYDQLVDYTRAVTAASFFAPARDWLEARGA